MLVHPDDGINTEGGLTDGSLDAGNLNRSTFAGQDSGVGADHHADGGSEAVVVDLQPSRLSRDADVEVDDVEEDSVEQRDAKGVGGVTRITNDPSGPWDKARLGYATNSRGSVVRVEPDEDADVYQVEGFDMGDVLLRASSDHRGGKVKRAQLAGRSGSVGRSSSHTGSASRTVSSTGSTSDSDHASTAMQVSVASHAFSSSAASLSEGLGTNMSVSPTTSGSSISIVSSPNKGGQNMNGSGDVLIVQGQGQDQGHDSLASSFDRDTHLTLMETWAQGVAGSYERRTEVSVDGGLLDDRHHIAGIFHFDDKVSLLDAWHHIGGPRVGVIKQDAFTTTVIDGSVRPVRVDGRQWIYPTLDGQIFNPARPLDVVSSSRYEIVDPNAVIQTMHENFRDLNGAPLNVTAIAFSARLDSAIVQFERPSIEIAGINDLIRRFFTVHIPILGSVQAGAVDNRWACMNSLPTLLSASMLKVKHLTGANDLIFEEFAHITRHLDFAQQVQAHAYNLLAYLPMEDGDEQRLIQTVFPYEGLPDGYGQDVSADQVSEWLDVLHEHGLSSEGGSRRSRGGRELFDSPALSMRNVPQLPIAANRKIVEQRRLAEHGIRSAIGEVGSTLWALTQANYAPTHHSTKSVEAQVRDMLVKGWRKKTASAIFENVLAIAYERGASLPEKLVPIAQGTSNAYHASRLN